MRSGLFALAVILTMLGTLGRVEAGAWQEFHQAYPKAVEAVESASLGDERKGELLNMLEAGKKINAKSALESNRRKAKKIAAEAMSILNQVMKIVGDEG